MMRRYIGFVVVAAAAIGAPPSAAQSSGRGPIEVVANAGHSDGINSIAFSTDGRLMLSGSADRTIRLWDTKSWRLLRTFEQHQGEVTSVAILPDGRRGVSGSEDKTVKLWDLETGSLLRTFTGHTDQVAAVDISSDGRTILSAGQEQTVRLWDVNTGRTIRTFRSKNIHVDAALYSRDGRRIASVGSEAIELWDAASGKIVTTFSANNTNHHAAAISPDGRFLIAGGEGDFGIKVWDLTSGRVVRTLQGHAEDVRAIVYSPDGRLIASGSWDKTIKVWNAATGQLLHTIDAQQGYLRSLQFSPNGRLLLSGGMSGPIKVWRSETWELVHTIDRPGSFGTAVPVSPDGASLYVAGGGSIYVREMATGNVLRMFEGGSNPLVLSPDGRRLVSGQSGASGRGRIQIREAHTGALLRTLQGEEKEGVSYLAFSPNGQRLVSAGSRGKSATIWDLEGGQPVHTLAQPEFWCVSYSPDGKLIASCDDDDVRLWDAQTGKLVRTFKGGKSTTNFSAAFSPTGKTLVSGLGGDLKIWDVGTGRELRRITAHPSDVVTKATFSPDGKLILSAGGNDTVLKLWDAASGKLVREFRGHPGYVRNGLAFTPDMQTIVSSSGAGTVKFWRTATGNLLATMYGHASGQWVIITPEGFFSASETGTALLHVTQGFEIVGIDQVYQALYRPDLVREKLAGDPRGLVREAAAKLDLDKVMASGAAPVVRIVAPAAGASLKEDSVVAEAEIADRGGGIGKVEWRLNGVTLGVDTRGLVRTDRPGAASGDKLTVRQTFALDAGENVIEVVAYNARGLIASSPASVKITREGAPGTVAARLHVLAVGINDYYDSRLRLNFAVPDAKAIGAALVEAGKAMYEQVTVTTVLDEDVKRERLDAVFAELAGKVRPSDVFVFFIAGHGKTVDGRYYFLPRDFRYDGERSIVERGIDQEQWQAWFARIAARKSVLLFDTCESGSLTADKVALRGLEHVAALERLTRAMGRTVLSASTDDAPALEGHRGHGLFTYTLLDALARGDADGNGLIDVTELAGYVDAQVPVLSERLFKRRQVPQMKIVGSNYPLAKLTSVLGEPSSEPIILRKPTHVVVQPANVFPKPEAGAEHVVRLAPGTQVTLVRTEAGWTLVARDGKALGYVATKDLAPLQ